MINGAAFGPDGRQPATARESLIFALPPRQPSWPEANVHVEATQVAAGHQKMSAAISSKNFLVNTWEDFEAEFRKIEEANPSAGVWYRGQSNSCWELDTTLGRRAVGRLHPRYTLK